MLGPRSLGAARCGAGRDARVGGSRIPRRPGGGVHGISVIFTDIYFDGHSVILSQGGDGAANSVRATDRAHAHLRGGEDKAGGQNLWTL